MQKGSVEYGFAFAVGQQRATKKSVVSKYETKSIIASMCR